MELNDKKFTRELVIFLSAFTIFPFLTIRVLIWNWHFWLTKKNKKIQKNHIDNERFNSLLKRVKK